MIGSKSLRVLAVAGLLFGAIVVVQGEQAGSKSDALGGVERYLTFVSTDKPIYRVGEKLYVRAAMLRADNHAPMPGKEQGQVYVEVKGPKGDAVASGWVVPQESVAGFSWTIPAGMSGGEYTVKVTHPFTGYVPGERKFDIRAYRAPRLKSQIVFLRDGYGPGDTAGASLHVDRAEGGIPENAKVTVVARVDGQEVYRGETKVDGKGNCSAQFKLPKEMARGDGTLAWIIEDGGVLETATKTIPILLQTVDLTMYPEGGDLVAGLSGRVYIEAFTPSHKPADLAGVIVDGKGTEVAKFRTEHEGRGRFELRPAAGEQYTLKITEPAGIKTTYPLPQVKAEGAAIAASNDVTDRGEAVKLRISSSKSGKLKVTLNKRENELAWKEVRFVADAREGIGARCGQWVDVELAAPASADGVLIATIWDENHKPLAERLVYRRPARSIRVQVSADKTDYIPGEPARLTFTASDEDGKPVGAVIGVTVTDDSVLEMIEKREQAPRMPVMVLLESDVKELADAQVYLDPQNPKAPLATDLLLGTQGWRRFAMVELPKFVEAHGDAARRALALRIVTEQEQLVRLGGAQGGWGGGGGVPRNARFRAFAAANEAVDNLAFFAEARDGLVDEGKLQKFGLAELPQQKEMKELDQALGRANARGGLRSIAAKQKADRMERASNDFAVVREYAHLTRPDRRGDDRVDFAETLYWNAGLKTDEKTGQATVIFHTSDAVTSFRVFADAFDGNGSLGSATAAIESKQPFYTEPKLPLELTSGDVIWLPVSIINGTNSALSGATLAATAAPGMGPFKMDPLNLAAHARQRRILTVNVGDYVGICDFTLEASAAEFRDKVVRKLKVLPRGFPVEVAFGGLLGPDGNVSYTVVIPADVVANSITSELAVYPTPLANMTQALEALLQSPYGCFEQTSSTTYPLVMAQQYFMSHTNVDPKLIEKSGQLLTEGYKRLIGFECKQTKGFEWFGADPGHEALSAYGLLEFTDMKQVREVDGRMLADARAFILTCRDGKGGFKRERTTLHTWINDPECSNGYITWALLECGEQGLEKEVAWVKEAALRSSNSYVIALGANVMAIVKDKDAAKALMDKLVSKQTKDGCVDGSTTSIVGSGGDALQIETTALATLAWLRDPAYAASVEKSMKWLAEACKAGRFGSTQSTVLALKAIVEYDKSRARPKASGLVQVIVDGKPAGTPVEFGPETQDAIKLPNIASYMTPGRHTVELRMDRGSQMPFGIAVRYNATRPESSEKCKVGVGVKLRNAEIAEGEVTEAMVTVVNKEKETIPTPIAIIGIPGGLEVRHDQLKELVKSGRIDAYEVLGREVVLYWREMKGGQKLELPISLVAAVPGKYTAPASRAYLYYTDEYKEWAEGISVQIKAKGE